MASREKKLAQNTLFLMVGKICTQCVSFFMLPLYTSVLSTADYGTADLIITYISLFSPLISLQFEQGLFRNLLDCRNEKRRQKNIFSSVIVSNLFQIIGFSIVCIFIQIYSKNKLLLYLYVLIVLQIIQGTLLQFARGIDKTLIYTIASFIYAFIHVGANVILVGIIKVGLPGLLISMVIAGVISIIYLIIRLKIWKYLNIKYFDKNEIKSLAKYSIPLIPNQLAWWIINASDRTIVSLFLGTGANGVYSVANKFSSIYITFYNYFNMSWTESVSICINDLDRDEYIERMNNVFFNLLVTLCTGIIACMPFVFPILINNKFKEAYNHIPILMMAVFFQALQGLYSAVYVALKKTKEIAKTSIFSAIINIGVNIILIRYIGLYAAAISTLVAFLSMCVYRYYDIKKYINFRLYKKNILAAFVVCLISCSAYYTHNLIIQCISLLVVVVYSLLMNKAMIIKILYIMKKGIGK